nr:hypothetical protein [Tanacetum cinerariifolium]
DSAETGPLRVIVYEYDGPPIQLVAPPSPDYVQGPEHPSSPDYVPGPKHPPSPVEIPYIPEPKYPEYQVPSDDEAPLEDQPLPADASPIAASPDYVADFDPEKDPEDDQADYPADGGDGAPLGYRAAEIRMRALLPSTSRRTDILKADMPPRKRAFLTTLTPGFKIQESFAAGAARQPGPTESDLRRYRVEQAALGRIEILEARDPEPQERPAEAGSSF